MKNRWLYILCFLSFSSVYAQEAAKQINEGNTLYKDGKYKEAEVLYKKAEQGENLQYESAYNQGAALYKQGRYEEAQSAFQSAINRSTKAEDKADALYNLGNSYLQEQKPKEAIDAYKESLKINPKDEQARYNLAAAKTLLQQQQEQQQNQDQNQDNQDQQDKDQNKENQDNKDQEGKDKDQQDQNGDKQDDQEQKDKENQDGKDGDQKQDDQQQVQQKRVAGKIGKEEAEKMLQMIKRKEEKLHQKKKQAVGPAQKSEKDW